VTGLRQQTGAFLPPAKQHHFPTESASLPRMFFRASLPAQQHHFFKGSLPALRPLMLHSALRAPMLFGALRLVSLIGGRLMTNVVSSLG